MELSIKNKHANSPKKFSPRNKFFRPSSLCNTFLQHPIWSQKVIPSIHIYFNEDWVKWWDRRGESTGNELILLCFKTYVPKSTGYGNVSTNSSIDYLHQIDFRISTFSSMPMETPDVYYLMTIIFLNIDRREDVMYNLFHRCSILLCSNDLIQAHTSVGPCPFYWAFEIMSYDITHDYKIRITDKGWKYVKHTRFKSSNRRLDLRTGKHTHPPASLIRLISEREALLLP